MAPYCMGFPKGGSLCHISYLPVLCYLVAVFDRSSFSTSLLHFIGLFIWVLWYLQLSCQRQESVPIVVDFVSLLEQTGNLILGRKFGFSFINRQINQLHRMKLRHKFVVTFIQHCSILFISWLKVKATFSCCWRLSPSFTNFSVYILFSV